MVKNENKNGVTKKQMENEKVSFEKDDNDLLMQIEKKRNGEKRE